MKVQRGLPIAVSLASLPLLGGLIAFAYAGTFSRFWADDYCYTWVVRAYGWIGGTYQWWRADGNRFSTLSPVALADLFGPRAISALPGIIILIWFLAWVFFLRQVSKMAGLQMNWAWIVFGAVLSTFFVVLLAPDRLQSLYWRMGTLHYTLPLPILLFMLGWMAWGATHPGRVGIVLSLACGFLAFFAAGLSETYAALQAGIFLIFLLLGIAFWKRGSRQGIVWQSLAGLLGTGLAMGVMLLSPSNAWRSVALPPPDNLLEIVPVSLRYALDFIFYSIRGQPLPYLVFLAGAVGLGLAVFPVDSSWARPGSAIGISLVILLVTYGLIVSSFAPSAYAGLQYPAGRALMPAEFILLFGLGSAVVVITGGLKRALPSTFQPILLSLALIAILAAGLYPLRAISVARLDAAKLQTWAARWDARDADIRRQVGIGEEHILTRQVEVVQTLEDYGPEAGFWINGCAALFYGAQSLVAQP